MKIIYIAHPISGDVEKNLRDIRRIVRKINLEFPDVVPNVPYYCDIVSLDDSNQIERERGIINDIALIKSGIYDELWLTGDNISFGMSEEIKLFEILKKPIYDFINKF